MKPKLFPELSPEQEATVIKQTKEFKGVATTLEAALGALVLGHHLGWRVLKMIHSTTTYRKYEKILGIRFEDVCPERTEASKRNVGLEVADSIKNFWAVAMGKEKVKDKAVLRPEDDHQ